MEAEEKSIFDVITGYSVNEGLDKALRKNREYMEIQKRIDEQAEQPDSQDFTKEQRLLIDRLVCAHGPCVYLNDLYGEYENGEMEVERAVDEVYGLLMKHLNDVRGIDMSGFQNWEAVKGNIYTKLINAEQNKEQLGTIPNRPFLDLAVVYYAVASDLGIQGTSTILIRNEHMEMWGQDEDALYQAAMSNMRSDGGPDFKNITDVIKNILPDAAGFMEDRERCPAPGMYVLTNRRKCFGASELLDRNTLHMIADKVGDGFIVLPSSLHEVIILDPNNAAEYEELVEMVKEVNDTQVSMEERLSYHVYVYSKRAGSLKIAV